MCVIFALVRLLYALYPCKVCKIYPREGKKKISYVCILTALTQTSTQEKTRSKNISNYHFYHIKAKYHRHHRPLSVSKRYYLNSNNDNRWLWFHISNRLIRCVHWHVFVSYANWSPEQRKIVKSFLRLCAFMVPVHICIFPRANSHTETMQHYIYCRIFHSMQSNLYATWCMCSISI